MDNDEIHEISSFSLQRSDKDIDAVCMKLGLLHCHGTPFAPQRACMPVSFAFCVI